MRLPPFVFLLGPHGCGKTTLANLLAETDARSAYASFDEPIREATIQIFFPDQMHLGLDLREEGNLKELVPFTQTSIGDWMELLRAQLRHLNPCLLGDLAKKRAAFILGPSFDRIIYDDASSPNDIKPFALAFGAENCKLIFIERPGKSIISHLSLFEHTFIPKVMLRNQEGDPRAMLKRLEEMLPSPADPYHRVVSGMAPAEPYSPSISEL